LEYDQSDIVNIWVYKHEKVTANLFFCRQTSVAEAELKLEYSSFYTLNKIDKEELTLAVFSFGFKKAEKVICVILAKQR